ncbi:MAG TPA: ABC transporter permease [Fibrobacteria bacterium]|nr:ABC transporter permease [Fibrobacteria bacterium]
MRAIQAILARNLIKFFRDKMRFFFTLFMSGFLLFTFSFVMKSAVAGVAHPMNYLISGIVIMMVFQSALNNSMSILEDISSGFMKEILVAPIARWQIAVGQVLSSAAIAVLQGVLVLVIGISMGLSLDPLHFCIMVGLMSLVGVTFSSLGLFLAAVSKESTTFQVLISVVTMPLTFLSGAYIPTTVLPAILRPIVYLNPLTYATSMFRFTALRMESMSTADLLKSGVAFDLHGFVVRPMDGVFITLAIGAVFFALCVRQFRKADFSRVTVFKRGGHR